jgi:hypothetical protein
VSAEIIEKLMKEHPADVVGISLPGSEGPGMGGEKDDRIRSLPSTRDGSATSGHNNVLTSLITAEERMVRSSSAVAVPGAGD